MLHFISIFANCNLFHNRAHVVFLYCKLVYLRCKVNYIFSNRIYHKVQNFIHFVQSDNIIYFPCQPDNVQSSVWEYLQNVVCNNG